MNSLVIRFAWGDLAVRGDFVFCLIIVVIFIGLGRAYRFWGGRGVEVIKWGKAQRDGTIFMGQVDHFRRHVKNLIWQLQEG